jgi:hypothetical protein
MDGQPDIPGHDAVAPRAGLWRDLGLVALLLLLAVAVRGWLMAHTEVLARDSIGFIRYALEFESDSWRSVLRNNHQHPGYPLTVLAVSVPVRACVSGPDVEVMAFSAQLASNLAAVLLVVPMFYLGKLLFHRAAGFGAAALFQCLPVPAHILSDGLSEPLFLLLSCTALVFAVLALRDRAPRWFALCGVAAGLAYLTRPEGLVVAVAAVVVLLALQRSRAHRRPWRGVLTCTATLLAALFLTGSPYVLATHRLTNKPSGNHIIGRDQPTLDRSDLAPKKQACARRPLLASTLAVTLNGADSWQRRATKSLWYLAIELAKCYHYTAWVLVLLGVWWFRGRACQVPGMWVVLAACGLMTVVLWRLAVVEAYMSDRHLMLIVLCGCYAAAAALWELPDRLRAWLRRPAGGLLRPQVAAVALVLLGATIASGMPKTLETLHGNRAGHHAAGLWLARHAAPGDIIEDEHCWAHYYAGWVFLEHKTVAPTPHRLPVRYVVIGRRDRDITLTWNRQKSPSEEKLRAEGGQIVYHWPVESSVADAAVVVYAIPGVRRN